MDATKVGPVFGVVLAIERMIKLVQVVSILVTERLNTYCTGLDPSIGDVYF